MVIRKPASPGYEEREPIVLLNHMDMVCVGMNDPLNDPIEAYVEDGWMKAKGTSLGADNGIGLSMALAVLEDDSIVHPALEVMTTTNEEDGMSGAAALSKDFLKGRKVINLDSEDYDTITTGAAGACLQFHRIPIKRVPVTDGDSHWYRIKIEGGLGGHSGVDINKGRCSAMIPAKAILKSVCLEEEVGVSAIEIDAFWYAQVKNHCLDKESLKTFCYLCSAIEGVFDDFGELVKWHLIHNVTCSFVATKLLRISDLAIFKLLFPAS